MLISEAVLDKGTILFVDDEENILSSLRRQFELIGFHVLTCPCPEKALKMMDEYEIDVIVSDMKMPNMDGAEFLKLAKQSWPNIGRILLTGYTDLDSAVKAINYGIPIHAP